MYSSIWKFTIKSESHILLEQTQEHIGIELNHSPSKGIKSETTRISKIWKICDRAEKEHETRN